MYVRNIFLFISNKTGDLFYRQFRISVIIHAKRPALTENIYIIVCYGHGLSLNMAIKKPTAEIVQRPINRLKYTYVSI